jgi:hypothetical protein
VVSVIAVHVEPLSCVISTTPVPVRRRTTAEKTRDALADVIVCSSVALPAVAVNVVALFTAPSAPVAVNAAVMFVDTHDTAVRFRLFNAKFVAPGSTSSPRYVPSVLNSNAGTLFATDPYSPFDPIRSFVLARVTVKSPNAMMLSRFD